MRVFDNNKIYLAVQKAALQELNVEKQKRKDIFLVTKTLLLWSR